MTQIEHFLLEIVQILFRDWIQNTIAGISRFEAATDIFQPTLRNCFTNAGRWYFFTVADAILFGVAVKISNVGRRGFFVWAQPKLCFGRHRHVFIYSARKTLAHLGKKHDSPILIGRNVSRRRPWKTTCRCLKKNHHRMTSIEHFLIDIIQILFRDWIENTIADIGRC